MNVNFHLSGLLNRHTMKEQATIHVNKMATSVLGFGNPVRSDDGVGVYVIEQLQKHLGNKEHIQLFDMGTSAFEVLFKLRGTQKILIVDGVKSEPEEVGYLYKVPAEELQAPLEEDPLVFLHSLKWDQALSYAKKILREDFPKDVDVYLIGINNIKLAEGLSDQVKATADRLIAKLIQEL